MSQGSPPPPPPVGTVAYRTPGGVPPQTNTLGLVGFILVMVGLVGVCFMPFLALGVVGTILCAIGVFRQPRGLAIAGLIVGGLELLVGLVIVLFIGTLIGGAAVGLNAAVKLATTIQTGATIRQAVEAQKQQTGTLPATLSAVPNLTTTTDAWGHAIHYVPNAPAAGQFQLTSDGVDGKPGTADDLDLIQLIPTGSPGQPTTAP